MKNRKIPFGYQYENGAVVECTQESEILKAICRAYTSGQSLLKICRQLNENEIEYLPGVIGWNKSRLMRIMEDERYLGNSTYPALIDAATHEAIEAIRTSKNTQKGVDRSADIFKLHTPIICPRCGSIMIRIHDSRCLCQQRWACRKDGCRESISLADEDLLNQIIGILNRIIASTDILKIPEKITIRDDSELIKLQNDISRLLSLPDTDKNELRKKMQQCISLKYKNIDHHAYAIQQMKADFEKSSPLSNFSTELLDRTVQSICLEEDGTVSLNDIR